MRAAGSARKPKQSNSAAAWWCQGSSTAHIHPLDIVDLDVCDLDSKAKPLRELSAFVARACVKRLSNPAGASGSRCTSGTPPAATSRTRDFPTLRVALDKAAPHEAASSCSATTATTAHTTASRWRSARNAAGTVVGYQQGNDLAGEFSADRKLVGVDAKGDPNGAVNEDARYSIDPNSMLYNELEAVTKVPEKIPARLNSVGITAMLDAMASPEGLPVYEKLLAGKHMTVRATLAQFYDPSRTRTADGHVDYDSMVAKAKAVRAKYATNPLVRADFIKMFADGVVEANPFAYPADARQRRHARALPAADLRDRQRRPRDGDRLRRHRLGGLHRGACAPGQVPGRRRRRRVHEGERLPSRAMPDLQRPAAARARDRCSSTSSACTSPGSTCTST